MSTFLTIPLEVRGLIYQKILTSPNGLPLILAKLNAANSPTTEVIVRDPQSFNIHQAQLDEALPAYALLRRVNRQVSQEVLEEFCRINSVIIRTNVTPTIISTIQTEVVPLAFLVNFRKVGLTGVRRNGYWPSDGGGPDIHVILRTIDRDTTDRSRALVGGEALSQDTGAMIVARAATRLSGRKLDERLLWTFIKVLEYFARTS